MQLDCAAHKLARIFYRMLKFREEYIDPGAAYYQEKYRQRAIRDLRRRTRQLGFEVVPAGD